MANCIICGTSADGPICRVHQEDVAFEFEGNHPSQLTPKRFYRGRVDGYADFGVFVDIGDVTGLLHRSKLDQRLESLDWEVGDDVFIQVNNIRDNGDIDLGWSIRQEEAEFRGLLVDTPDGDHLADEYHGDDDDDDGEHAAESTAETDADTEPDDAGHEPDAGGGPEPESDETADFDRIPVEELDDHVGDVVRLEGEVVSARQTSGPTVFELRDETGVVDCAAFVEAGVRAYPDVEADDVVRIDGEVRLRRDEIQVETESLVLLDGTAEASVRTRMEEALDARARPDEEALLADDDALSTIADDVTDVAAAIRRAVLESRPVVVRHDATTDGYVAGVAIERAVLPLVESEHAAADAVYHYFDRRPLEDGVYDMNDATKDVTRMLGDRERHDERLPLFVFAAAGSTAASADGLELLSVYGAPRVVLDGRTADDTVADKVDGLVTADERTASTVAADVARNLDVGGDGPAAALDAVDGSGLLVRTEVARQRDQFGGRFGLDDIAGGLRRDGGHVHPHGVFGVVGEAEEDAVADDVRRHFAQLAVAGRRLGGLGEGVDVVPDPGGDRVGLADVSHAEHRRPRHGVLQHPGGRAVGGADRRTAAVDRRHEGSLGRR